MVGQLSNMYLVNAPAGSGKTTYIENMIIDLLSKCYDRKILTITYTNRAKEELKLRIDNGNVTIDTIHAFLSSFISPYLSKKEVVDLYLTENKEKIESLIAAGESESKNKRYIEKYGKLDFETVKSNLKKIHYNEQSFSSPYYGGLSHDDLLSFSRKMFDVFPILRKRLSNKYEYIFIDEYQDTSADVLFIFYFSILNSKSNLYLLGDKMQEIYDNYDGSFDRILNTFNQENRLDSNYRCSAEIINVLNSLYNDQRYSQKPVRAHNGYSPRLVITDMNSGDYLYQYNEYMQLYLFNRQRFEKIGVGNLYDAVSGMKSYKFPSKYSPVDVLTDRTNDNPDKLFQTLFSICQFVSFIERKAYGNSIRFAKDKHRIFNSKLTDVKYHDDKIIFSNKVEIIRESSYSKTMTIIEFCQLLIDNEYCNDEIFLPFFENEEYQNVLAIPIQQIVLLYSYLGAPQISTQHGVKGEGHSKVCFISEDSKQTPIVHMYEFLRFISSHVINLTDFQRCYYNYKADIDSLDLILTPASLYKDHKADYVKKAQSIKDKYQGNIYFDFFQLEKYNEYLLNPTSTNAKECFKFTKIKGALWAYKLFYVGCSRAKNDLTVVVDINKIAAFKSALVEKMTSVGFEIKENGTE